MKNRYSCILFLTIASYFVSCKKFVQVGPPSNQVASSTVFLTAETATAAINGMYSAMSSTSLNFAAGGPTVYLGLYSDELATVTTTANILEFADSKLSPANSIVYNNFWRFPYQYIYQANSCIAGLQESPIPNTLRSQLLGESYFIRAFCYWQLVSMFGDVPLVVSSSDFDSNSKMERTTSNEVMKQILSDLAQAKSLLSTSYPTSGRYRPNYYTALALLSRIHTYLGNWNEVLNNSNEIIAQSSTYLLEADLSKVFLIGSNEAIWQTSAGQSTTDTYEGFTFVPATSTTIRPSYLVRTTLYDAFTALDKRKANWIASKVVSGTTYRYPFKYKVRIGTGTKVETQMMIRLAEIYLNRAEAKAKLGDATAIDDLNKIRTRAGLSILTSLNGQALVDAIIQERRLELFAEWGLRYFDLKRIGQLDATLAPIKSGWVITGSLFPIPLTEMLAAPNLTQNPGYN
ncbi:putative outer membrane starch-binding protein [Lacibacter cauensis]|uniref:Putative outer membrane starch-binding protein n=1 Tax=Lacibacter cauensis TaxID=510947 RepID=A0A562SYZ5_9BACT|nr:RagB/SusD family nutrient uptake outer membrane protein [Lacibacter cauensis]TWI85850.1 putative outer membrane starch-binding protein [Lacibacter cauensis]